MILYPRMKCIGSISCICAVLLLSSCTVDPGGGNMPSTLSTRRTAHRINKADREQREQLLAAEEFGEAEKNRAEEIERLEAEAQAAAEEQARLEEEARLAAAEQAKQEEEARKLLAEQAAHQEAEARRLQAEQARKEAEAKKLLAEQAKRDAEAREAAMIAAAEEAARIAKEQEEAAHAASHSPQLISSRGRRGVRRDAAPDTAPSDEQQAAAREMLAKQEPPESEKKATPRPRKEKRVAEKHTEPSPETTYTADVRKTLRNSKFIPTNMDEDDDDTSAFSLPNSVELRGLRSPSMRGQLPMNIDGKIIKNN